MSEFKLSVASVALANPLKEREATGASHCTQEISPVSPQPTLIMQTALPAFSLDIHAELLTPSFEDSPGRPWEDLNPSRPLSELLREGTARAHEDVEHSPGAAKLANGQLEREEYIHFLMMLWHVYDTLERALDEHASHPLLAPTYRPTLLARAPQLSDDLAYFLDTEDWQSHPQYTSFRSDMPPELQDYVSRIDSIRTSSDPYPLLAHSYVRYLGDLSGGQHIRRRIAIAYDLQEDGAGTRFYEFERLEGGTATRGDMRRIKEWFRQGMDEAVRSSDQKATLMEEANEAFRLNGGLFANIAVVRAPNPSPTIALDSVYSPLLQLKPQENEEPTLPEQTSGFPIASVIAVLMACSVAHFALVVMGFTGQSGYDKFVAAQVWVREFLGGKL